MRMVCDDCGRFYDSEDICTRELEYGQSADICVCGAQNSFVEAEYCEICGEEHHPDDLYGGICINCLYDHSDKALEICDVQKESVRINSFLWWAFTADEIEHILIERLKKSGELKHLVDAFISENTETFSDMANEWRKHNERI